MMSGVPGTSSSFPHVGPSPSSSQIHAHMTSHFQPAAHGPGQSSINQTPVPIPQPPHHAPPQMHMHPIQYQQHRFAPSTPNFNQAPGPHMHHQQMQNPLAYTQGYNQAPPPPVSRTPMAPAPSNPMNANMYNPPRPPEVYTLPEAVNEAMPPALRQKFQRDENGRVLFFTAPPLDRMHQGSAENNSGLGHSAKYLAGRNEWLVERDRKRKDRIDKELTEARKRSSIQGPIPSPEHSSMSLDAEVIEKYFASLNNDTIRWNKDTGLEGWRGLTEG